MSALIFHSTLETKAKEEVSDNNLPANTCYCGCKQMEQITDLPPQTPTTFHPGEFLCFSLAIRHYIAMVWSIKIYTCKLSSSKKCASLLLALPFMLHWPAAHVNKHHKNVSFKSQSHTYTILRDMFLQRHLCLTLQGREQHNEDVRILKEFLLALKHYWEMIPMMSWKPQLFYPTEGLHFL